MLRMLPTLFAKSAERKISNHIPQNPKNIAKRFLSQKSHNEGEAGFQINHQSPPATNSSEFSIEDFYKMKAEQERLQRIAEYERITGKSWAQELQNGGPLYTYEETKELEKSGRIGFKKW